MKTEETIEWAGIKLSEPQITHHLSFEAQPIADQWMGKCSCGWRESASIYEFDSQELAMAHLQQKHAEHIFRIVHPLPFSTNS